MRHPRPTTTGMPVGNMRTHGLGKPDNVARAADVSPPEVGARQHSGAGMHQLGAFENHGPAAALAT